MALSLFVLKGDGVDLYEYLGPVVKVDVFGNETEIDPLLKASTYAVSEAKAKSNLIYRYRRLHGYSNAVRLKLPGKFTVS